MSVCWEVEFYPSQESQNVDELGLSTYMVAGSTSSVNSISLHCIHRSSLRIGQLSRHDVMATRADIPPGLAPKL
jgi:hypothetical protein